MLSELIRARIQRATSCNVVVGWKSRICASGCSFTQILECLDQASGRRNAVDLAGLRDLQVCNVSAFRWQTSTFWCWNHQQALAVGRPNITPFPARIEEGADVVVILLEKNNIA